MLKTSVNIRYSKFNELEKIKVRKYVRRAFQIAKVGLPKKTGKLQSCFHYEIIGDEVYLYISDTCFYAEYLLDKPKTRTYWDDCRNTFVSEFYANFVK